MGRGGVDAAMQGTKRTPAVIYIYYYEKKRTNYLLHIYYIYYCTRQSMQHIIYMHTNYLLYIYLLYTYGVDTATQRTNGTPAACAT
mmetsp:Transcript_66900/g.178831  ORF Transcript_66900/g.178831 Transcript_66900/m.178831 type:complete len:86 (+) Transcript_66900:879-1136(+)